LIIGNISFFFAFGYFSAYSSRTLKALERKRQEESLRNAHKLLATGHLIGSLAHDMLNYLFSIRGYIKILLEGKNRCREEIEALESIERLERKSSELLQRLSKFSKKTAHEFTPVDIHKTLEETLELVHPLLRYSKISIEKIFQAGLPAISADADQLQEAFVSLVLNAIDAVGDKEGKLTIQTSFLKKSESITVVFADTGRGMSREELNRIGELFFTTKEPQQGLGLGLMTTYGIISRHHGKIEVDSSEGKGTTFSIILPVAQLKHV
jgi:signal transduction histidine kinase